MTYIDPKEVKSPRAHWTIIDIIYNKGDDEHSLAIGKWDDDIVLAMRWNGTDREDGIGNPQSRGLPTWFVVPREYYKKIIEVEIISEDKRNLLKGLLGLENNQRR